jgi:hypothetical protein
MSGIREDFEKKFYEFLSELGERVGADRVQQVVESAITGAARTKKAVDKNVETLLSMANIPSRRDYERMRAKLDALQGTIVHLTRTVEELRRRMGDTVETRTAHAAHGHHGSLGARAADEPHAARPRRTRKAKSAHSKTSPTKRGR